MRKPEQRGCDEKGGLGKIGLARVQSDQPQAHGGQAADAGGQPVHSVDQVEGVDDADDGEACEQDGDRCEPQQRIGSREIDPLDPEPEQGGCKQARGRGRGQTPQRRHRMSNILEQSDYEQRKRSGDQRGIGRQDVTGQGGRPCGKREVDCDATAALGRTAM